MVASRLSMYVHSVTMRNENVLCVAVYIYVKHGHDHLYNEYCVHSNSWPHAMDTT